MPRPAKQASGPLGCFPTDQAGLRSATVMVATPPRMRARPRRRVGVSGSPSVSAATMVPVTGTPRKPSDVVMAGQFLLTVTAAQNAKAVAIGPL